MSGTLSELPVLVLDCQATGASPKFGHLMEIAWCVTTAATGGSVTQDDITCRLISLPPDARLPRQVSKLTGIGRDDLKGAPLQADVWRELTSVAAALQVAPAPAVAHWSRFERAFLTDLHTRHGIDRPAPLDLKFCTHEIAARLLPDLPRRGLHALAGYFGYVVGEHKRATPHVHGTAVVWSELVALLADEHDVHTAGELAAWMKATRANRRGGRGFPMPREVRLGVSKAPGVYRMLARGGTVLYVGKATNLQRRLNSYWQKRRHGSNERMMELLTQVRNVDVTVTGSTLEAALLETDEIKRCQPPYNKALRARGETTWYLGDDLQSVSAVPDGQHRLGPLPPSRETVDLLAALAPWLGGAELDVTAWRDAIGFPGMRGPEEACVADGIAWFMARHGPPTGRTRLAALHRVGADLWRLAAAEEEEVDDDEETDWSWDPERVASTIEKGLMRAAHLLRRGRWLRRLANASIGFEPKGADTGAWRLLSVSGGRVVAARDLDGEAPLPAPGFTEVTFDPATYDRLRVLTTELRRLVTAGARVSVRTGEGRAIGPRALAIRLAWL